MKKLIVIITTTAILAAGTVASASLFTLTAAGAQEPPAQPAPHPGAAILDKALAKLVAKGTLTQEQADAVRAAVRDEVASSGLGARPDRRELIQRAFAVAADTIGVDVADLEHAVIGGQSVAEVAEAHGVDPQTVVDAIVKAGTDAVDKAVADGKLSEQAGAAIKQRLPEGADRFVHFTKPTS